MKEHISYIEIEERYTMKMKQKIHKYRIRDIIKDNSILHTQRCTARKIETYLRYTFFMVQNLVNFGFYCGFTIEYRFTKKVFF